MVAICFLGGELKAGSLGSNMWEQKRTGGGWGTLVTAQCERLYGSIRILSAETIGFADKSYVGCKGVRWLSSFWLVIVA